MADTKVTLKHNLYVQLVAPHAVMQHTAMMLMTNCVQAAFQLCSAVLDCLLQTRAVLPGQVSKPCHVPKHIVLRLKLCKCT